MAAAAGTGGGSPFLTLQKLGNPLIFIGRPVRRRVFFHKVLALTAQKGV
jgi:hypothetical protein